MDEPSSVNQKLPELAQKLEADLEVESSAEKIRIGILAFLVLFCCGYMTWIYRSISMLDAPSLTRMAGDYANSNLGNWRKEIELQAVAKAPELSKQMADYLSKAPSMLRIHLEETVHAKSALAIKTMEKKLAKRFAEEMKKNVRIFGDKSHLELNNDQKLEFLLAKNRKAFKKGMGEYLVMNYEDFTRELSKVDQRLKYLLAEKDLTSEDRIQKDLIALTVVLVEKYHKIDDRENIRKNWGNRLHGE